MVSEVYCWTARVGISATAKDVGENADDMESAFKPDNESRIVIAKNSHSPILSEYRPRPNRPNNAFHRLESVENIVRLNDGEDVEGATGDRDSGYGSDDESRNEFVRSSGDSYDNSSNSRQLVSLIVSYNMSVMIVLFRNLAYIFKIKDGIEVRMDTMVGPMSSFESGHNGDNANSFCSKVRELLTNNEEKAVSIGKTKWSKVDSGKDSPTEPSRVEDKPSNCRASNAAGMPRSEDSAAFENDNAATFVGSETRNSDSPTHSDIEIDSEAAEETDMKSRSRSLETLEELACVSEPVCIRPTTNELRCPPAADVLMNSSRSTIEV